MTIKTLSSSPNRMGNITPQRESQINPSEAKLLNFQDSNSNQGNVLSEKESN